MAVLAVSAVAVGSASAALPEFKAASFPVTFTSTSVLPLEPTLKTLNSEIKCKMSTDKGEIVVGGTKLVSKVVVTYTECTTVVLGSTVGCKTAGQAGNTIVTQPVMGELGYIKKAAPISVGILFHPETAGTTLFAEFACSIVTVKVTGSVIGLATPINVSQTTGVVSFIPAGGPTNMGQAEKNLEGGPTDNLEAFGEESSIMDTENETFSTALEVKA